jgi:hypothetical protein
MAQHMQIVFHFANIDKKFAYAAAIRALKDKT